MAFGLVSLPSSIPLLSVVKNVDAGAHVFACNCIYYTESRSNWRTVGRRVAPIRVIMAPGALNEIITRETETRAHCTHINSLDKTHCLGDLTHPPTLTAC